MRNRRIKVLNKEYITALSYKGILAKQNYMIKYIINY